MLTLKVTINESFDSEKNEFVSEFETIDLEHSLVSLSKWESFFEKPFLSKEEKTTEQVLKYIECMIVSDNFSFDILSKFNDDNFKEINTYINSKMTATWFNQNSEKSNQEVVTSELIYYWMSSYGIPFECETWHLNRLLTLIQVFNIKNSKPKKMSSTELAAQRNKLNAERRKQMNSSG